MSRLRDGGWGDAAGERHSPSPHRPEDGPMIPQGEPA